jgi:hypothetical protein
MFLNPRHTKSLDAALGRGKQLGERLPTVIAHPPRRLDCRGMSIPLQVFREYEIRGLVATELTPEFAEQLGRGFGRYLLDDDPAAHAIVLCVDHRRSS